KLTWGMSLAILFLFYLFGRLWINFLERGTPFRIFARFKTALHVINTVIFFLASFTLLGFEPGEAAITLEIRLRHEREEYGLLRTHQQQALNGAAINQAYDNAVKATPNGPNIRKRAGDSIDEASRLQSSYNEAKAKRSE